MWQPGIFERIWAWLFGSTIYSLGTCSVSYCESRYDPRCNTHNCTLHCNTRCGLNRPSCLDYYGEDDDDDGDYEDESEPDPEPDDGEALKLGSKILKQRESI